MDEEVEDILYNNTDDLNDFDYELSPWDYVQDSFAIIFALVGVVADIIIIYMIARNVRMRTKTNLILMNLAINDGCFLLSNMHFIVSLLELSGASQHISLYSNCMARYVDVGFQFNETVFVLILMTNTLMKNKRFKVKYIVAAVYSFIVANIIMDLIFCHFDFWPVLYLICFISFMLNLAVVLFKEFNNCYKNLYKKDPLSRGTRFRLNISRIYIYTWFSTFFLYIISTSQIRYFTFTLAQHSFIASLYILIYIVYNDKNFKICLLNMLQCKGAGNYDVDATITFAEDSCDDDEDNNQVNINFNAGENATQGQTHVQDISTIRVP